MTGLEIAAAALTVAGGAISAGGAMQQAQAQKNASRYEQQVALRDAKIARDEAAAEQEDKRSENRRQLSAIRAAYASNGLEMSGSPLDVLADTAIEQELDVARIGYRGEMKALGKRDQAAQAQAAGSNAMKAGIVNILGTVVKTGSSLMSLPTPKAQLRQA